MSDRYGAWEPKPHPAFATPLRPFHGDPNGPPGPVLALLGGLMALALALGVLAIPALFLWDMFAGNLGPGPAPACAPGWAVSAHPGAMCHS